MSALAEIRAAPGLDAGPDAAPIPEYTLPRADCVDAKDLPVWQGELYLEMHRGTYTTQSRNKRANRKSER